MVFSTIHTTLGLTAMASAEATGAPINLTHMAVGDGGGNATTPSLGQTTLVRELFRASPNRVYQSPTEPNRFTAELVIPATEAGFTLREVGVFDSDGSLFVVGNLPATYKPMASEGAYADTVVRIDFMVANASIITLQIDPNVAVATQQWISNNVTAAMLLPGGTTGQVLRKHSNADGDTEWADPANVNVTVSALEEIQTLSAAQTVVNWAVVNNTGLAIYVEGVRLRTDQWTAHPTINTRVTLGQAYPAGTKIIGTQNEPANSLPDPLVKGQNLADLPSKPTARSNLDVFSKAEARQLSPAGQVAHFCTTAAPTGWMKANGAAISRTAYSDLYAAIGTTFGAGDGFTTFNLPDLRGEFIRGFDDARGVDGGRGLGTAQGGQNAAHSHAGSVDGAGSHSHTGSANGGGGHSHSATTGPAGAHSHSYRDRYWTDNSAFMPVSYKEDAPAGYNSGFSPQISYDYDGNAFLYIDGTTGGVGDHTHSVSVSGVGDHTHTLAVDAGGSHTHTFTTGSTGGSEARPRNIALLACIKY